MKKITYLASTNEHKRLIPLWTRSGHFEFSPHIQRVLTPCGVKEQPHRKKSRSLPAQTKHKQMTLFSHQSDHFEFSLYLGGVLGSQCEKGVAQTKKITFLARKNEAQTIDTNLGSIGQFSIFTTCTRGFYTLVGEASSPIKKNHITCQRKRLTLFLHQSDHFNFHHTQQGFALKFPMKSGTKNLHQHEKMIFNFRNFM